MKQYLHCLFESVTTANSSIVIHFQISLPFLCPSDLFPDPMLHPHPLPQFFNVIKLNTFYCCLILFELSARVTNIRHKKPVTLRRIYAKVNLLLSLSVVIKSKKVRGVNTQNTPGFGTPEYSYIFIMIAIL